MIGKDRLTEWKINGDPKNVVYLLLKDDLKEIPNLTELTNIFGEAFTKGIDEIDLDDRGGRLAFGIRKEQFAQLVETKNTEFKISAEEHQKISAKLAELVGVLDGFPHTSDMDEDYKKEISKARTLAGQVNFDWACLDPNF